MHSPKGRTSRRRSISEERQVIRQDDDSDEEEKDSEDGEENGDVFKEMVPESVKGAILLIIGVTGFIAAVVVIGWNETQYVCDHKGPLYAENYAKEVKCDEGRDSHGFAYFSCPLLPSSLRLFTACSFNDNCGHLTGVNFTSAAARQTVEMYQCTETCRDDRGYVKDMGEAGQNARIRTCEHELEWSKDYIETSKFEKPCPYLAKAGLSKNPAWPTNLEIGDKVLYATAALAGTSEESSIMLNQGLIEQLAPEIPVELDEKRFRGPISGTTPWKRPLTVTAEDLMVLDNYALTCKENNLGCIRIKYFQHDAHTVTALTSLENGGKTSAQPVKGSWFCSESDWQAIVSTSLTKDRFISSLSKALPSDQNVWVFRVGGMVFATICTTFVLMPIAAGYDIPLVPCMHAMNDKFSGIENKFLWLISASIAFSAGLQVIAGLWLMVRPIYGIFMCFGVCICCICNSRIVEHVKPRVSAEGEHLAISEATPREVCTPRSSNKSTPRPGK